ncbi:uncharacterized protein LOC131854757 [Achroia grisella]|uniref:uncharacterized protein LOC131854757 n=1 Tax=Achroia grisella TaxID=688607 RepID=UPI0027D24540|nr:uncharacterized protein LOC131854757 [Achroia grisella]
MDPPEDPGGTAPEVALLVTISNNEDSMDTDCSFNLSDHSGTKRKRKSAIANILNNEDKQETSNPGLINNQDNDSTRPQTSISRVYYQSHDAAPFIVHIQKILSSPDDKTTLHPIDFGRYLKKSFYKNVVVDGSLKKIGRNRLSISFSQYKDANSFIDSADLKKYNYNAFIPAFNLTRMGLIRGVPVNWSDEEIIENISVPLGCGKILKVRRLKRKTFVNGISEFIETETIVITFDGQVLPKRVFICYNSIPVDLYIYPTIQCYNCCRYGHVKNQCRSVPRCYKCGKGHTGESCSVEEDNFSCCICQGGHQANSKQCPELSRQKAIKETMAKSCVSYAEASKLHPPTMKPYADIVRSNPVNKNNSTSFNQDKNHYTIPTLMHRSYKKTVIEKSRQPPKPTYGFNREEYANLIKDYSPPAPADGCGDFNAQHQYWGSSNNNCYGNEVLDIVDIHNLCILNTGTPTRRTAPNEGTSAPDLSICTPNLASTLIWQTLSLSFGSDHFPILIHFPFNRTITNYSPRMKYNLSNADWDMFLNFITHKICTLPLISVGNENECSDAFATLLLEAADGFFPKKGNSRGRIPSPPWWDNECTLAIKKRKEAEKAYNFYSSWDNFNIYSEILRNTKKLLREKKIAGWKHFCSSISPNTNISQVWSNIRRFRHAFNVSRPNSLMPSLVESFLDRLAPAFVSEDLSLVYPDPPQLSNMTLEPLEIPFSLDELKSILSKVRDSTPGNDGIPYSFITHLDDSSLNYYLKLINTVVDTGNIPKSWKLQQIIPILKTGKPLSDPASYRPIALSSVLLKLTEHLVKNRLEWFVEHNDLLSNSQYGFRKGMSTLDSLSIFTTDIRLSFTENKSTIAAFLDIKAAYDNVSITVLQNKLNALNIPPRLTKFIINMLSERSINLENSNPSCNSNFRVLWKGLPQGSVLSPILYNIYTYDLENSVTDPTNKINILQYADDILFYVIDNSVQKSCTVLTSALERLGIWLQLNGLELSVTKSTIVHFTRMRTPPPISIYYKNILIPVKSQTVFLGLLLDSKLTGLPHFEQVSLKCEKSLNILRCLSGVWWGAHPYSLKLVYNAIIRSILDYGTFLLDPSNGAGLRKLDAIQSKALRIITGAMKSSPVNALQVECCDPPLNLRRQFLADKFLFRISQYSKHPLLPKLQILAQYCMNAHYWRNKSSPCLVESFKKLSSLDSPTCNYRRFPLFCVPYEALTLIPDVHLNINITKNDPNANAMFNYFMNVNKKDYHHVFCDASKHNPSGGVGVGVYHKQFDIVQKIKLPPESSIFTGECFGIFKALDYILTMKLKQSAIFSDSISALQALQKAPFKSNEVYPVIIDARKLLQMCISKGYVVSFFWIPGHSGIQGNVTADRLASEAIGCGDVFPYKNYSHDLAALPVSYLRDAWNETWPISCQTKARHYFNIQPKIPVKPWFYCVKLSKRATTSLIRMRLGHMSSPSHLAKLKIVDTNVCDCGIDVVVAALGELQAHPAWEERDRGRGLGS